MQNDWWPRGHSSGPTVETLCSLSVTLKRLGTSSNRFHASDSRSMSPCLGCDVPHCADTKAVFLHCNSSVSYVTAGQTQLCLSISICDLFLYSSLLWYYERHVCYCHQRNNRAVSRGPNNILPLSLWESAFIPRFKRTMGLEEPEVIHLTYMCIMC